MKASEGQQKQQQKQQYNNSWTLPCHFNKLSLMNCKSKAEAFARSLQNKLQSLGRSTGEANSDDDEDSCGVYGTERPLVTSQKTGHQHNRHSHNEEVGEGSSSSSSEKSHLMSSRNNITNNFKIGKANFSAPSIGEDELYFDFDISTPDDSPASEEREATTVATSAAKSVQKEDTLITEQPQSTKIQFHQDVCPVTEASKNGTADAPCQNPVSSPVEAEGIVVIDGESGCISAVSSIFTDNDDDDDDDDGDYTSELDGEDDWDSTVYNWSMAAFPPPPPPSSPPDVLVPDDTGYSSFAPHQQHIVNLPVIVEMLSLDETKDVPLECLEEEEEEEEDDDRQRLCSLRDDDNNNDDNNNIGADTPISKPQCSVEEGRAERSEEEEKEEDRMKTAEHKLGDVQSISELMPSHLDADTSRGLNVSRPHPDASTRDPDASTQDPSASTQDPDAHADVLTQNPVASIEDPDASTQNPVEPTQDPDALTPYNVAPTQDPDASTQNPGASTQDSDVFSEDSVLNQDSSSLNVIPVKFTNTIKESEYPESCVTDEHAEAVPLILAVTKSESYHQCGAYQSSKHAVEPNDISCCKICVDVTMSANCAVFTSNEDDLLLSPNDDFPQRVQRSSSLKSGKTPPGTPMRKKIVRFADALGLDLEAVKTVFLDDLPTVPSSAYKDLQESAYLSDDGAATVPSVDMSLASLGQASRARTVLVPLFSQPGSLMTFLDRVRRQFVCLESAVVTSDARLILIIRVSNLDFQKSVVVRHTSNDWLTYEDQTAVFMEGSCDGFSDKFHVCVNAEDVQVGNRLVLAVRYVAKNFEYWDNNNGQNYVFQCFVEQDYRPSPPDESWIHFL